MAENKNILSLSDFYTELSEVGARLQHQFQVQFMPSSDILGMPSPNQLTGDEKTALERMSYWGGATVLPGRTQNTTEIPYLGFPFSVPTTTTPNKTFTCTLRCSQNNMLRNAMMKWLNFASQLNEFDGKTDLDVATGGGDKRIPNSSVIIRLLDQQLKNVIQTYTLYGAFPTTVGDMTLDQAAADIATFEVQMMYQFFKIKNEV